MEDATSPKFTTNPTTRWGAEGREATCISARRSDSRASYGAKADLYARGCKEWKVFCFTFFYAFRVLNNRNLGVLGDVTTMFSFTQKIYEEIVDSIKQNSKVDALPLMSSPYPVLCIVAAYLVFVLGVGPRFMRNREPFRLKLVIAGYNACQVFFSLWLATMPLRHWEELTLLTHDCTPVGFADIPDAVTHASWWYFFSKIVELLDTVFFVLRKKQSQVTFLHMYHHTIMVVAAWWFLKYAFMEHGIVVVVVNSLVHVVMYTYYLLAGMGPSVRKYLWWKKYITWIQLVQFIVLLAFVTSLVVFDCKLPKIASHVAALNLVIFFYLFARFYRRAYRKVKPRDH